MPGAYLGELDRRTKVERERQVGRAGTTGYTHTGAAAPLCPLPAEMDPACLLVMLMAAVMATTTLPHVIEGVCDADPQSAEFVEHFAGQVAVIARLIGLEPA